MTLITSEDREAYLRTKNKFYVAGWVAAEGQEKPQKKPEHGAFDWKTYGGLPKSLNYESYQNGYGDCMANGECLANNNSGG